MPRPPMPFFSRTRPALKAALQQLIRSQIRSYSQIKMSSIVSAHIQVLGTGASELSPSFYLFTDSRRYLFNCGENLQRFRTEFRPPLTVTDVFVTHVSWHNLGGFPGIVMTCRDQGVSNINLHGPELLEEFAELTRFFVGKKKISLSTPWGGEGKLAEIHEDENVKIKTVPLYSSHPQFLPEEQRASPDSCPRVKRRKMVCSGHNSTVAFVCKLSDVRGKFDVAKAKALGVPPSPLYKKLQNGESVTAPNGRTVHSHEVMGSPKIGPVMIVIECPEESYIPSVTSNSSLGAESFRASNQNVALIVHMSPLAVLNNKGFQEWMSTFGSRTEHLVLNKDLCPQEIGLRRFLKIQAPLHLMNPRVYHPLVESSRAPRGTAVFDSNLSEYIVFGKTLLKYHLKPAHKMGIDSGSTLGPLEDDYTDHFSELTTNKPLVDTIQSSRSSAGLEKLTTHTPGKTAFSVPNKPLIPKAEDAENPVITFLGTGSAAPTCYRNVSGILVQTATSGNMLLDCGEGTLSQIYRCFGKEAGDRIVRDINGVFISHIHGDHHLGLVGVLVRREELGGPMNSSPLVIAPSVYLNWLSHYSNTCRTLSYHSIQCNTLEKTTKPLAEAKLPGVDLLTVPVIHCASAYGVLIKHSSGWSVVYSGDTRPCQELVKAGSGATVLIHEATFEDVMIEDAKTKMHCTFGEALKVSSDMNPGFTLMTHFSSRYPRIPSVLMDSRVHSKVGIAVDCMSVYLRDLDSLHDNLPAMKEVFAHVIGAEDKDSAEPLPIQDWGDEEASA